MHSHRKELLASAITSAETARAVFDQIASAPVPETAVKVRDADRLRSAKKATRTAEPPDNERADGETLLPDSAVCRRYGVSSMSLWRWDRTPELGFPKPIRIQNRKYRRLAELRAWEASRRADVLAHNDGKAA
jgi:hypothetical protein